MLKSFRENAAPGLRLPDPAAARAALLTLARFLLLAALAFAMSRATLARLAPAAALAPFAMALFAAGASMSGSAAAMLAGCMAGGIGPSLDAYNLSLPIGCAVVLAGMLGWNVAGPTVGRLRAARRRAPEIQARSPNDAVMCAALAGAATLVPGLIYAGGRPWPSAQAVAASLAALAAAPFFRAVFNMKRDSRFLLPEERVGLFLTACAASAGLYGLYPPIGLGLSLLTAALSAPSGAVVGAGLGAGLLAISGDARCAALPGLCGVAAQLCARWPRPARAGSAAGIALAASLFMGMEPASVAAACAAPLLAALLPASVQTRVARWAGRAREGFDPDRLAAILRAQTAGRLRALGAAFGDLAEGYLTPAALPDEQALMGKLRERLCDGCPGYGECWAGETNRAAHLLCDLVAAAVNGEALFDEGVPAALCRRCRRARLMPERIGETLEDFARARRAELKRGGENRLISAQFLQARQLVDALAAEQSRPVRLRDRQAQRAAAVVERADVALSDAMLLSGRRAELILTLKEGRWTAGTVERATGALNAAFGRVYAPAGAWGPTLRLARQPRLAAEVGAGSVSRESGNPSGDSHLAAMIDDERLLVLICDGMGSGEAAARESAQAARLLGRFLAAGADWALAVETVNAMLLNVSAEDMFSTMDMLILNLSTGMAEFMKLAACPAMIVREGTLRKIEGGRLPLGILERVQPAACRVALMPGDRVFMASDGVMDAVDADALEALLLAPEDDMNALTERVLALAGQSAGGHRDDMTAVCLRIDARAAA